MATKRKTRSQWGISAALIADIKNVFRTDADTIDALKISPQTWRNIVDRRGVRQSTALNSTKVFFSILREVKDGKRSADGLHHDIAVDTYKKYEDRVSEHDYLQFVEQL